MRTAPAVRGIASVLAVTLALAGCTKSSTPRPSAHNTGAAHAGGAFIFGQTAGVTQLDPNTVAKLTDTVMLTLLYNGLTKVAPDGSTKPDLATKWTTSPDGLSWTFTLRSGVKFHSGKKFTAADAVKNIDRVLDPKVTSQGRARIAMVAKATAKDDTTLVLDLKTPNPQLPASLVPVKMTDVANIDAINKTGDGTGPYRLKRFVPGDTVELVRNDSYFGDKPNFDSVKIARYADITSAEGALRSGDISALFSPPATAVNALATGGRQVLEAKDPGGAAVFELDTTSGVFRDERARQALSYATDRKAMLGAAYAGRGTINNANVIISPSNPLFDKSLESAYPFDLAKAKELFAAAGINSGTALTFWTIGGSTPEFTTEGVILQQDLAKIGIKLKIVSNEVTTWAAKFYPKGKSYPNMVIPNTLSFPPAPISYSADWFSMTGTCECNWKAPDTYNAAVAKLDSSSDTATLTGAYATVQGALSKDSPVVVILNQAPVTVAQSKVTNAWVDFGGTLHLEDAGFTV